MLSNIHRKADYGRSIKRILTWRKLLKDSSVCVLNNYARAVVPLKLSGYQSSAIYLISGSCITVLESSKSFKPHMLAMYNSNVICYMQEKMEEIWPSSPMTKAPLPTEHSKKRSDNTKSHQNVQLQNDSEPKPSNWYG